MKKLISIEGYINKEFDPDGAPSPITVRRWCNKGEIPARKIGGQWYIERNDQIQTTGNPLVDKVLAG